MRSLSNTKLATRNRKLTTYLFLGTIAVLLGSFFFINQSLFTGQQDTVLTVILQVISLPIAFVLTLMSVRMTNLWAREPRPEKAIENGLKGLSKKSVIYHYYHIPARHVLIAPQGVFAITTRWHTGQHVVNGDNWNTKQNVISRAMSGIRMDGLGNPTRDALKAAEHVKNLLADIAPDVDVTPVIVFVDQNVELDITDPVVPVLYANPKKKPNLTDYLREINRDNNNKSDMPLTPEQIQAFEDKTITN